MSGFVRFDFISGNRASFIAYVSNDVNTHRTKPEGADEFYQKHIGGLLQPPRPDEVEAFPELVRFKFSVKEKANIVSAGLGWITVTASVVIAGWAPKGVDVLRRKALIQGRRETMSLRGKQEYFLCSKAYHLQPIFQIGKGGINSATIVQTEEASEKRELIEVSLSQNTDEIAERATQVSEEEIDCEIAQIIGRVVVLYRPSTKEKYQKLSNEVKVI